MKATSPPSTSFLALRIGSAPGAGGQVLLSGASPAIALRVMRTF